MIERRRQMSGSAASPHMEPVHRQARLEAGVREAAHVSGLSGAFKTMHQNHLAARCNGGLLRLNQHLYAGFGLKQVRLRGQASGVEAAGPKISGDGEDVMVGYYGTKRPQFFILARISISTGLARPVASAHRLPR